MVELAFTHLGYFFKSGFREAHFFVFWLVFFLFFFFLSWCCSFCVETCFCGIPMFKVVF